MNITYHDNEPINLLVRDYDAMHRVCLSTGWSAETNDDHMILYTRTDRPTEAEIYIQLNGDCTIDVVVPIHASGPYATKYRTQFVAHGDAADYVAMHATSYHMISCERADESDMYD